MKSTSQDIVIITGLSGAGRTEAMHAFEDLGFFVIDNLPPKMIFQLAEVVGITSHIGRQLAVVCDLRSQGLFDELSDTLADLNKNNLTTSLLFLDCDTATLKKRYAFSRRKNPIAKKGESIERSVERERALLSGAKKDANIVIDTSKLNPHELHTAIFSTYGKQESKDTLEVQICSFGYRYGIPRDFDILLDMRFIPNPYWVDDLRELSGKDKAVQEYVMKTEAATLFFPLWERTLATILPAYIKEGRSQLKIGFGCTGGRHRSVVAAEKCASFIESLGYATHLEHLTIDTEA